MTVEARGAAVARGVVRGSCGGGLAAGRFKVGPLHNPVRGVVHGSAALILLVMAGLVLDGPGAPDARAILVVFALSQGVLFAVSSLYHSVPWTPRWKRRMQRIDHAAIYLGIAGGATPIVWLGLDPPLGLLLLGAIWGIGCAGAFQKLFVRNLPERASIPVQILQSVLALPALVAFVQRHPGNESLFLLGAAACYALGAVVFLLERPRLWPRVFSFHEVFHLLVVAGCAVIASVATAALASGGR